MLCGAWSLERGSDFINGVFMWHGGSVMAAIFVIDVCVITGFKFCFIRTNIFQTSRLKFLQDS
tara:strand:+ start:183 stop:371 length:189 start_codon:yes stop_codon:yes gene_type:complete